MIYLQSILLTGFVISILATIQLGVFVQEIKPEYYLMPVVVTLVVGTLLGKVFSLRRQAEARNELFRAVAELGQEFGYVRNTDGSFAYVSPSCVFITGYEPEAFYRDPDLMERIIHPTELAHWHTHNHKLNDAQDIQQLDFRIITRTGETRWLAHICDEIYDKSGLPAGTRSTNVDVTERVRHKQQIERIANYDPLTDLPNRRFLLRHVNNLIERLPETGTIAILFLDLDRFKHLNDTHGHAYGDLLLTEMAERFRNSFPDNLFCARFGGDEFVFTISGPEAQDEATYYAERIIKTAEQPFLIHGRKFYVSGSIGISLFPRDGDDVESLIREADVAMYKAKSSGSGSYQFFHEQFTNEGSVFLDIETRLRDSLENDEFLLHYQPLFDMHTGDILGTEALARWMNADRGLVSPADFIPVAEETGLIIPIGEHLLEMAMLQARQWQEAGVDLRVSVNISGCQFRQKDFIATLKRTLDRTGCPANLMELEITENILLEDIEEAIRKVRDISDLGMRVALDDFGTGYSSFNYLRQLHFNNIKIDRAFVMDLENDIKSQAIVESIISLSHSLDAEVTAEGIETEAQKILLRDFGADIGQGFLLARPAPVSELQHFLYQGDVPATDKSTSA